MSNRRFKKGTFSEVSRATKKKEKQCRDPGSNQGPLDLQSNALPTELSLLRH